VSEVPVYSPAGRLLSWAPLGWCERHAPHLRLVRTRRGVLKRAMLRSDDGGLVEWLEASGRRSSYGHGYQRHLPCGRVVWALKGVRGSSRWGASGSPGEPVAAAAPQQIPPEMFKGDCFAGKVSLGRQSLPRCLPRLFLGVCN